MIAIYLVYLASLEDYPILGGSVMSVKAEFFLGYFDSPIAGLSDRDSE